MAVIHFFPCLYNLHASIHDHERGTKEASWTSLSVLRADATWRFGFCPSPLQLYIIGRGSRQALSDWELNPSQAQKPREIPFPFSDNVCEIVFFFRLRLNHCTSFWHKCRIVRKLKRLIKKYYYSYLCHWSNFTGFSLIDIYFSILKTMYHALRPPIYYKPKSYNLFTQLNHVWHKHV